MRRPWPLVLVLLGGCATLRALLAEPTPYGVPAGALKVPGSEARAVGVAFSDYIAQAEAETEAARLEARLEVEDGGISPDQFNYLQAVWDCYDSPDFYDAWIFLGDGGTHFVVDITTKPELCFGKNAELYGGGAIYEIDAKSFEILKKEMQE